MWQGVLQDKRGQVLFAVLWLGVALVVLSNWLLPAGSALDATQVHEQLPLAVRTCPAALMVSVLCSGWPPHSDGLSVSAWSAAARRRPRESNAITAPGPVAARRASPRL